MNDQYHFICALSWVYPGLTLEDVKWLLSLTLRPPFLSCRCTIEGLAKITADSETEILKQVSRVCQTIKRLESEDIELLHIFDPKYPQCLRDSLQRPPLILCTRGDQSLLSSSALGVVGSRNMLESTANWMQSELSYFLNSEQGRQMSIISGGAVGVDQLSHQLAVLNGVPTIAVMPVGILHVYPRSFQQFLSLIPRHSILQVSPFAPWQTVRRGLFHFRNEILTALSQALLIVQAQRRSGSWLSANLAIACGREVGVVPGHPTETAYLGCLDLLADGAKVVRNAQDVTSLIEAHPYINS